MLNDKVMIRCWEPVQTHRAITTQLWPMIKSSLLLGCRLVIEVRRESRSLAENAMLHALLTRISQQKEWAGQKRDVETWKRLLTAAWVRARGEQVELLPALDGHGVDIVYVKTSQLNKAECAELIEFVLAWMADQGIQNERADQ